MEAAFAAYGNAPKTVDFAIDQDLATLVAVVEQDVNAQFLMNTFANLQTGIIYKDICLVFVRFLSQLPVATRTYLVRKFLVIAMTGCGNNQIRDLLGPVGHNEDATGRAIYERWLRVANETMPPAARSRVNYQLLDPQFNVPAVIGGAPIQITYNAFYNQFETAIMGLESNARNNSIKLATRQIRQLSPLNPKLASIIGSYLYTLVLCSRLSDVVDAATANTFNALMIDAKFQAGAGFIDDRVVVYASVGGNVNIVVPVVLGLMAFPEVAVQLFPVASHGNFLRRLLENSYGATIGVSMYLNRSNTMNLETRNRIYASWDAIVLKARTIDFVNNALTAADPTVFVAPLCYLKAQRLQGQLVSQAVDDAQAANVMNGLQRAIAVPAQNQ